MNDKVKILEKLIEYVGMDINGNDHNLNENELVEKVDKMLLCKFALIWLEELKKEGVKSGKR